MYLSKASFETLEEQLVGMMKACAVERQCFDSLSDVFKSFSQRGSSESAMAMALKFLSSATANPVTRKPAPGPRSPLSCGSAALCQHRRSRC